MTRCVQSKSYSQKLSKRRKKRETNICTNHSYDQYLITGYTPSTQPKNKDVAKAIIRRFTDAMANHDHAFGGYDLTTFSSHATYIGTLNHRNLEETWTRIRIGGGTRVMTGWQKVKEKHFQKHSESATLHPVFGWQAGPQTPMLRLLLLLDGEATDMDEFELELLGTIETWSSSSAWRQEAHSRCRGSPRTDRR